MSFTPEVIQQIKDTYEKDANSTYTSIGKTFQVTRKVIARLLKKLGVKPKTLIKDKPNVFVKIIPPKPKVRQLSQCSMYIYCSQSCTHRKPHFPIAMLNEKRVCNKSIFCEVVNKKCRCQPIKPKNI